MISLDTNYLINALVAGSPEADAVFAWLEAGEDLCVSSVAWYEFLCGPVDDDAIDTIRTIICDRVLPYTADQAVESARLFNAVGRKRSLRVDSIIAASAIVVNASLATGNMTDFENFVPFGLRLA
jgi:predicted nucleic acid-binding protein